MGPRTAPVGLLTHPEEGSLDRFAFPVAKLRSTTIFALRALDSINPFPVLTHGPLSPKP